MEYEVLRPEKNRTHEPNFIEMVEKTIEILRKNPKGFFLMAEGTLFSFVYNYPLISCMHRINLIWCI